MMSWNGCRLAAIGARRAASRTFFSLLSSTWFGLNAWTLYRVSISYENSIDDILHGMWILWCSGCVGQRYGQSLRNGIQVRSNG
jgi:hypothetical protein